MKKFLFIAITFFFLGAFVFMMGKDSTNTDKTTESITPAPTDAPLGKQEIIGWLASFGQESLEQKLPPVMPKFSTFSPMLYRVMPDSSLGRHNVSRWDFILRTAEDNNIPVMPVITDEGDNARIQKLLTDDEIQLKFVEELIIEAKAEGYAGWSIDIEILKSSDRESFSKFIKNVAQELHDNDLKLNVIAFGTEENETYDAAKAHDYKVLGRYADQVQLMIYYFSNETSDPGGQTPDKWYREVLRYAKENIPQEKIVVGLSGYGNEWVEGREDVEGFTYEQVQERITQYNADVSYDAAQLSQVARFTDNGEEHTLYFENADTISRKMEIAREEYGINKFAIWQLTATDQSVWEKL